MEENTTSQEVKNNNVLVNILLGVTVILLGYIGYIYSSHDMVNRNDVNKKYILQEDVTFEMLPENIKSKYIILSEHDEQIDMLNNKISTLSDNTQSNKTKIIEKIVEVEKVISINIPVQVEETEESTVNSKKFNTYTCSSMEEGSIIISANCIKKLHNFLDENKNAKSFEVIGMVDNQDLKFLNSLIDVYDEKRIALLSKYSQIGLSRQRVIEAYWNIKEYVSEHKTIKIVNYTLHSENRKGFVVRAYK